MRFYLPHLLGLALLLADQLTKVLIRQNLVLGEGFAVVPGFFSIVHVQNRGAAFGLLNNPGSSWQTWLFAAASVLAVACIVHLLRDTRQPQAYRISLGLILGGAAGNLVDRVWLGHVTDFLDVFYNSLHWPAFNIADTAICAGVALMAWTVLPRRNVSHSD